MSLEDRALAVAIVFSLTLAVRLVALWEAGGWKHQDGIAREGAFQGVVLRLLFVLGGVGGIVAFAADPSWRLLPVHVPAPLPTLGLVLAEVGLALLVWVHIALGVHHSGTLHLRPDHHLVQSGPYRRIRHPMYTSFLLLFAGLALLVGDVFVAGVLAASQVWVLGVRLRVEEAMLAARFPEDWPGHCARTGRLFPRLGQAEMRSSS